MNIIRKFVLLWCPIRGGEEFIFKEVGVIIVVSPVIKKIFKLDRTVNVMVIIIENFERYIFRCWDEGKAF